MSHLSNSDMAPRNPHFLVLPVPAQGHINPMLQFASSLLLRDCTITFVLTQQAHSAILGAHNTTPPHLNGIHFFIIRDGSPLHLDMTHQSLRNMFIGIQQQQGSLETLIQSSTDTNSPISCIIFDLFFPWVHSLAQKFGIPSVPFWSSNATLFHIGCLGSEGKFNDEAPELDEVLRGLQIRKHELLAAFQHQDPEQRKDLLEKFKGGRDCSHILVNSFQDLEAPYLLGAPSNLRYIGPCISAAIETNARGSFYKEDEECLGWLDMQEKGSVVYISLGSVAFFAASQMEEIALGIEASNHKFLWVCRPDAQAKSKLPDGFEQRTKGQGMIISWAPQLRVLQHPSLGAFFTHCGWNSTLESIFMGVPMLCFPVFAEQPLNALLIERLWQVGIKFKKREDGVVDRGEVVRAVTAIMEGEEGIKLRDQASKLKASALKARQPGGPYDATLASFLEDIMKFQSPLGL